MQKPHRDVRHRGDERTWLGCHLRSVDGPIADIGQHFRSVNPTGTMPSLTPIGCPTATPRELLISITVPIGVGRR
jgi:hypothetical protein